MGNINFHRKRAVTFVTSNVLSTDRYANILRNEIKKMLEDPTFDNRMIMNHVLNKICLITGSEYGCICRVGYDDDNKLSIYRYATTNVAWNAASDFYLKSFPNHPSPRDDSISRTNLSIIDNEYDDTPYHKNGIPQIKRYMSVPCSFGCDSSKACTIYVCNKLERFNKNDALLAKSVLSTVSHLI